MLYIISNYFLPAKIFSIKVGIEFEASYMKVFIGKNPFKRGHCFRPLDSFIQTDEKLKYVLKLMYAHERMINAHDIIEPILVSNIRVKLPLIYT